MIFSGSHGARTYVPAMDHRAALLAQHVPLARKDARRHADGCVPVDDLRQPARLGSL